VVPPRKEADRLLAVFWQKIHPLYPFLDRADFESHYSELWSASAAELSRKPWLPTAASGAIRHQDKVPQSRRFHLLLNALFAVSCHSDTSEIGLSQSKFHVARAPLLGWCTASNILKMLTRVLTCNSSPPWRDLLATLQKAARTGLRHIQPPKPPVHPERSLCQYLSTKLHRVDGGLLEHGGSCDATLTGTRVTSPRKS
jgi:hypothetical protein